MNGYNWAIPFEYELIGKSDYPIEIFSILESWHRIEISFEKLVPADLKKLKPITIQLSLTASMEI
jgi:hypothetical protein